MSLVPHNTRDWTVVLHDPGRGAIVLYDELSQQVSVIQHDAFTGNSSAITRMNAIGLLKHNVGGYLTLDNEHIDTVCSACGQIIPRESSTPSSSTDVPEDDDDDDVPTMRRHSFSEVPTHYSKSYSAGFSSDFRSHAGYRTPRIDANYFKLLGDIPTRGARISKDAFSEGYYDRFFRKKAVLGQGSKGSVYLVEHVLDGVSLGLFALKKVPVGDDREWLEKVLAEVHFLRMLTHPNLVGYNHVWLETSVTSKFVPSVPCAFILQEYCNAGTLEDYVCRTGVWAPPQTNARNETKRERIRRLSGISKAPDKKLLSPVEILSFMLDISKGVSHLHAHHIVHRDLKPSNCLLNVVDPEDSSDSHNGIPTVLVSDFGEGQLEGTMRAGTGSTGTLEYCAPELLIPDNGQLPQFSKKTDIFSLGMILYYLCFSKLPYELATELGGDERQSLDSLIDEVKRFQGFGNFSSADNLPRNDIPPVIYELLSKMLSRDPAARPTAGDVVSLLETINLSTVFTDVPKPVALPPLLITNTASRNVHKYNGWQSMFHNFRAGLVTDSTYHYFALKMLLVSVKIASILKCSNRDYRQVLILLLGIELPLYSIRQTLLMFAVHVVLLCLAFY